MVNCQPAEQLIEAVEYAIQGIYGSWSLSIYAFNVYIFSRMKYSLHRTFTRLYVAVAFWSSVYFLLHYLIKRSIRLGLSCDFLYANLKDPNWYISPYRIVSTYCPIILFILHCLISLHRVTVIRYPLKSKIVWEENFYLIMAVAHLFPFTCMWFVVPCKGYVSILPMGGLTFEYERIQWFLGNLSASFFAAIAGIFFGSLTLVNTCLIIYLVKVRRLKTENGTLIFEVLMAIFTLIYSASQAFLFFTSHLFPDPDKKAIIESFRDYLIDMFILPQAWILFFCNKRIQAEFDKLITRTETLPTANTMFPEVTRIK